VNNTPEPLDPSSVPPALVHTSRRARFPLVWIVPILASLIGAGLAARAILERGPSITIAFADAEGIEAGKTKVRYRNVEVGEVRAVSLAKDLRTAVVLIDMAKFAKPLLVVGARFWVVRPRLGAAGVSGLSTLLSGDYIGMDAGLKHEQERHFVGLKLPPVVVEDGGGKQFELETKDLGSLGVGAPAYFHHIRVGEIISTELSQDGHSIVLKLFVEEPYDRFVTSDTRFWHASGVDVSIDAGGVRLRTESVASVLAGGIAFETPNGSTSPAAEPGARFHLATTRQFALRAPDRVAVAYVLHFDESLRGLVQGAAVNFRGVDVGEVVSVTTEFDKASRRFSFPVLINIYPERIRPLDKPQDDSAQLESHAVVASMIEEGFRAQLRTGSLLTGQLYVALDFFPQSPKLKAKPELFPMPIPTARGDLAELESTVVRIAHKIDQLPIDSIGRRADKALLSLDGVLQTTNGFIGNANVSLLPEAKSTLTQARRTLEGAEQAIAPQASLQNDLHATLTSVGRAADSIRVLADYLDRHPEALIRGKAQDPP
jgi:paraquat-inducible protein B